MNIAFLCLSSSNNAIAQGFRGIVEGTRREKDIFYIGTKSSLPPCISDGDDRSLIVEYARNMFGAAQLLWALFGIRFFVKKNNITRVFVYSPLFVNGVLAHILPSGTEMILWLHDPVLHSGERVWVKAAKCIDEFLLRISRKLSLIIVGAEFLKTQMQHKSVFSSFPVKVIKFPFLSNLVSGLNSAEKKPGSVIFFGRIEGYKGLQPFCKALSHWANVVAGISEFTIAGSGYIDESVFDCLRGAGKLNVINKFVPDEDLRKLIARHEIAVFPYIDATATQAIQTAGVLGCKVISSNVGGLPEYVLPEFGRVFSWDISEDLVCKLDELMKMRGKSDKISVAYCEQFKPSVFYENILMAVRCRLLCEE